MARISNVPVSVAVLALFAAASATLFGQQSGLQTSFLTPASVRPQTIIPLIVESEHLPYIAQLTKQQNKPGKQVFEPSPSDLRIQQAEERFRNGRRLYQNGDFDGARAEFDGAIDAMLQASESPTDRMLFETRLEEMIDTIHLDDLGGLGAGPADEAAGFDKAPLEDIVTMTFPVDPGTKDKVRSEVRQTSSALPLVVNDTVLGYINYFNGRGHKTMEAGLARAGKYRDMISRILAEEGVPQELIHLAQAESGFLPRAVSRAAAEGMWQFVKFRGNEYGLQQTPYSDDRLDPEKATRAAARHLHDLFNEFGDWYLAIAAYNCGPGCVERAVERTGYADYWELRARRMLPAETTNYVPIILAMTIMAKNSQAYGLDQVVPEPALEYDTIITSSPTNLALIGDLTDTPLPELLQLNPALLHSISPANFEIRVPKGSKDQLTEALNLVPAERRASWRMHRVEAGENLASIARAFNTSATQIASVNNLPLPEPAEGDRLLIPAVYRDVASAVRKPGAGSGTTRSRTSIAVRKTTAGRAPAVAAKRAPHKTAGTLAQAKPHARPLNR